MKLQPNQARLTLTKDELDLMADLLEGYSKTPDNKSLGNKVFAARWRIHTKQTKTTTSGEE